MHTDMHGISECMNTAGYMYQHVSTRTANQKPPDSPTRGMKSHADGPLVLESQMDLLGTRAHAQTVVNDLRRPANIVRHGQNTTKH